MRTDKIKERINKIEKLSLINFGESVAVEVQFTELGKNTIGIFSSRNKAKIYASKIARALNIKVGDEQ